MKEIAFPLVMPTLHTERLLMRELNDEDVEHYFAICSEIETMKPYGIRVHQSHSDTKKTIEYLRQEFEAQRGMRFGVFLKSESLLIGDCGFWKIDARRLRAEAGAKIALKFARQGLMSEALLRLGEFAFHELRLHAIEANIAVDNLPSQKLVERIGFIKEGMRREFSYCAYEDRFKDSHLYSMLKQEFLKVRL